MVNKRFTIITAIYHNNKGADSKFTYNDLPSHDTTKLVILVLTKHNMADG